MAAIAKTAILTTYTEVKSTHMKPSPILKSSQLVWSQVLYSIQVNVCKGRVRVDFIDTGARSSKWITGTWQGQTSLQWRHYDYNGVSNHQPHGCLLNCLFRRRSEKTSKLRVTGLCAWNSPGPVNSPHKGPVTRKMFPFDDVIMVRGYQDDGCSNGQQSICPIQPCSGALFTNTV